MTKRTRQTKQQKERARELRIISTMPEKVLWNVLKNRQVAGLKFRREFPIGPYFGDFACPEVGLIVELDGKSHDGQQVRDTERTEFLESQGYRVYRVTNDDVLDDVEVVAIAIAREAGVDVVAWLNGQVVLPSQEQQP